MNQPGESPEPLQEPDTRDSGVRCPGCNCRHVPVIPGAIRHYMKSTRRKRRCRHCRREFWTTEMLNE